MNRVNVINNQGINAAPNEDIDENEILHRLAKTKVIRPLSNGIIFGLAWLGTFYFLKYRIIGH